MLPTRFVIEPFLSLADDADNADFRLARCVSALADARGFTQMEHIPWKREWLERWGGAINAMHSIGWRTERLRISLWLGICPYAVRNSGLLECR